MNIKLNSIANLRWGVLPYTAGAGLHVGADERWFPNATGIAPERGPGVDLIMDLARGTRTFGDGIYDWVFVGDALKQVAEPQKLLAECWRVLGQNGFLIVQRPTTSAYDWIVDADSVYTDFVHHATLTMGVQRVDVFQKLAAGEGRHTVPAVDNEKTVAVIRTGGFGDALWASSILPLLKAEGYHVTVYVQEQGEEVLRHDPHIDRLIVVDGLRLNDMEWGPYWAHEIERFERWINLVECVEKNMLAVPNDLRFFWPAEERRRLFGGNYLEAVHRLAGVPRKWAQKFYATPEESTAAALRQEPNRKTAVFAISGSTLPKYWPYATELIDGLIARRYAVWVLGELRGLQLAPREGLHVVGREWSIREALAFSQRADLVVGQETGILNAVAFEPMRKVVLLSHSTAKNLTQHWTNTVALHGTPDCYPCHQIHYLQNGWHHCNRDEKTQVAKCQSTISVDQVLDAVDRKYVIRAVA